MTSTNGSSDCLFGVVVVSGDKSWTVRRSFENFAALDKQLHRCIYDRKYSLLPEIRKQDFSADSSQVEQTAAYTLCVSMLRPKIILRNTVSVVLLLCEVVETVDLDGSTCCCSL